LPFVNNGEGGIPYNLSQIVSEAGPPIVSDALLSLKTVIPVYLDLIKEKKVKC